MHSHDTFRATSTMEHRRSQPRMTQRLKIIQEQAGHEHASTTSIYTCVSSDYRTRTLRRALDATLEAALRPARRPQ
jgi:integrase